MKLHAPMTQEEAEGMITRGPSIETGWQVITEGKRRSPEDQGETGTTAQYGTALSCVLKHPRAYAWRATVANCKDGVPVLLVQQSFSYNINNEKVTASLLDNNGVSLRVLDGDWIVYHDSGHILVLPDIIFHKLYDITRFK